MKESEVAKQSDLSAHIKSAWNIAHSIWPNIRPKIPYFTETASVSYTPTSDSAWHDVTVAGAPTNAVVIAVLSVYWQGDADVDYFSFYTRKNGSSATYEGVAGGAGRHGSMIFQVLDTDNKYEYYSMVVSAASYTVTQVGYLVIPK
jgi:hypothetical protein